ncbi:MAG: hypothetical protein HRU20_31145 [Pseudomonadales bacterium]|nr:hypothetical protein [Pseudomonadales bacterium]
MKATILSLMAVLSLTAFASKPASYQLSDSYKKDNTLHEIELVQVGATMYLIDIVQPYKVYSL